MTRAKTRVPKNRTTVGFDELAHYLSIDSFFGGTGRIKRAEELIRLIGEKHDTPQIGGLIHAFSRKPWLEPHRWLAWLMLAAFDIPAYRRSGEKLDWSPAEYVENWRDRNYRIRLDELKEGLEENGYPVPAALYRVTKDTPQGDEFPGDEDDSEPEKGEKKTRRPAEREEYLAPIWEALGRRRENDPIFKKLSAAAKDGDPTIREVRWNASVLWKYNDGSSEVLAWSTIVNDLARIRNKLPRKPPKS